MSVLVALMLAASPAPVRDCEHDGPTMYQVRDCLYEVNQERLDAVYDRTVRAIRTKNKNAVKLLVAAQESWTKFSSDSCAYTAAVSKQIPEDAQYNCWLGFVEARIKVLQAYRRDITSSQAK
jgi:uncharacterized protein YecT (DUF1311 family)